MLSLDRIVNDILDDLRDVDGARFKKTSVVRAFNEAVETIVPRLLSVREKLLLNIDNNGRPALFTIPAAESDGVSRIQLPPTVGRIVEVQLYAGSVWRGITELRKGEWRAGIRRGTTVSMPIAETTYEFTSGKILELSPGLSSQLVNGCLISYENVLPRYLMGTVTPNAANSFILPAARAEADGQFEAEETTDYYKYVGVRIFSGTGSGQPVRTITSYVGGTRLATFDSAFAPALDGSSKFAMVTPFTGVLGPVDTLAKIRACIVLLGTKRNEDTSLFAARYNELEEELTDQIESLTPGPQQIIPVDAMEDASYY